MSPFGGCSSGRSRASAKMDCDQCERRGFAKGVNSAREAHSDEGCIPPSARHYPLSRCRPSRLAKFDGCKEAGGPFLPELLVLPEAGWRTRRVARRLGRLRIETRLCDDPLDEKRSSALEMIRQEQARVTGIAFGTRFDQIGMVAQFVRS